MGSSRPTRALVASSLASIVALAVVATACGSFDNQRFAVGEGAVTGTTAPSADVWVVGHPSLAVRAGTDGTFRVEGVPVGRQALIVSATKGVGLHEVQVVGGSEARISTTDLSAAGSLTGTAPAGALVWVPGTPLVDRSGPSGTFQSLPEAAKWLLSFGMLLGRLELFTVLILVVPSFWRD